MTANIKCYCELCAKPIVASKHEDDEAKKRLKIRHPNADVEKSHVICNDCWLEWKHLLTE